MKKFLNGILALTASVVVFAVSGNVRAEDVKFSKVNSLSDLAVGDEISIVNEDNQAALSTVQKSNNRGATKIELINEEFVYNENVQLITLAAGIKDNTFAFNVGNGFLYAASSSGNQLKTQASIDDNASWKIDINDSSTSIVAQGTNSRKVFQYNKQNNLFACYSSASQSPIAIYKKVDSSVQETTYDISFNANGGKFADSEGVKITKNVGEKESIDLSKYNPAAPYPYAKLSGWTNGENTYAPADVVEVSSKAIFKAKWEASKILTVEEAIEVANSTGTTQTTIPYTVEGYFVSVDDSNSITIKDSKGNEFVAYAATKGEALEEGDLIRITGYIINYNNKTPEINRGGTYEIVSNATPEDKFAASKVKASLSFDWSSNDKGEYSVSNLKLRFGVMLDSKNTVENGTYGALLISAYDLKSESFTEVIKSYNQTTVDGILASNDKIIKKEVTIKDNVLMCSIDDVKYSDAYYVVFYVISNDTLYLTEERADLVGLDIVDYATNSEEYDLTIDEVLALYSLMLESDNSFKEN